MFFLALFLFLGDDHDGDDRPYESNRRAFVQTPQIYCNRPNDVPFGHRSGLFYGLIQQGKGGLNSAFYSKQALTFQVMDKVTSIWRLFEMSMASNKSVLPADYGYSVGWGTTLARQSRNPFYLLGECDLDPL